MEMCVRCNFHAISRFDRQASRKRKIRVELQISKKGCAKLRTPLTQQAFFIFSVLETAASFVYVTFRCGKASAFYYILFFESVGRTQIEAHPF